MSEASTGEKRSIRWTPVLWFIHLHFLSFLGIWLIFTTAKWMTVFFTAAIVIVAGLGVTVGAHRLWAHRSFEASGSLKLFLMIAHTIAGVGTIYDFVLAHRIHHKFYGTDKDPYNHKKGFMYSHFFSNVLSNHPDYDNIKTDIDMRDIEGDIYVSVQKTFYWILFPVFTLLLPLNAPLEYWDESMAVTVCIVGFLRCAITANTAWLVNSGALIWNVKPNEKIPTDGNHIFFIDKSFWPAYHYMVPWDWKTDEFGHYGTGWSTIFIKMMYELGHIKELQTLKGEDVREALYKVATKQTTMASAMENLKMMSEENAKRAMLLCGH